MRTNSTYHDSIDLYYVYYLDGMAESYEQLREMPHERLIELHDHHAEITRGVKSDYLNELRYREKRALMENLVEHVASIANSVGVIAKYYLAKWKAEACNAETIDEPSAEILDDPRNN